MASRTPVPPSALRLSLALVLVALPVACRQSAASVELVADVRAQLAEPAQQAGIEVDLATEPGLFASPTGTLYWKPVTQRYLADFAKLFRAEFAIYSRAFLGDIGVRRVYLCCELTFVDQARMALPEFGSHTLYLDTSALQGGTSYARRVIHHELFHMLDYADDGLVYADEAWCRINPSGWKYGTGGKNAQDNHDSSLFTDKYPGFLNHYSTTGVEEDKAEIYASVVVEPRVVDMLVAKDPVLARKLDRMGVLLAAASPHAGAELWTRIYAPIAKR